MKVHGSKWGWTDGLLILTALLPTVGAVWFYDQLPGQVAIHFGINGQANGYQDKLSFLIVASLLTVALPVLIKVAQTIDPKRENYTKFRKAFEIIRVGLTVFFSAIYGVTLAYNLGIPINMQMYTLLALGVLYLVIGNYMGQVRYTYFVGIRIPWTLANDEVWRRTHRIAGPLFMLLGLISIISAFLPGYVAAWVFFFSLFGILTGIVGYSYILYRKLGKP